MSKTEFKADGSPENPMVAGRIRARRIKELEEVGIAVSDDFKTGWGLVAMDENEFAEMLDNQAPDPRPKDMVDADSQKRIIELEKKLAELTSAPTLSQDALDAVVEKVLREKGLFGKERDTHTDVSVFHSVTKALEQIVHQNAASQGYQPIRRVARAEVDFEDVLEQPVFLFSYRSYYAIYGDKRNGQDVATPYGTPIKFNPIVRTQRQQGSSRYDKSILSVCQAQVLSKKELEFLRSHTRYGIEFFENINEAASVDVTIADAMASVANEVHGLTQHEVITRARNMGLPLSQNVGAVKRALIEAIARKRIQEFGERNPARTTMTMTVAALASGRKEETQPLPVDFG